MYELASDGPSTPVPTLRPSPAEQQWFACYTRARHEKQVVARLQLHRIESFCPVLPRQRQWHDRVKVIEWPLFPSYVFVRCAKPTLSRVLGTPGIVTVVSSNGAPVPIAAEEIENVRRFAAALRASGERVEPVPLVERGTRVRIISGPFVGVEGLVIEHRGRNRVLVGIEAIAQSWEIEVPAACMEPMRDPRPVYGDNARRAEQGRRRSYV